MGDARARAIHQATLNVLSSAILQGDMEVCDRYIAVPFHVTTLDASATLDTRQAVQHWIGRFRSHLMQMGATSLVRTVQDASFLDDTMIRGAQITEVRRNGDLLLAPYRTITTLVYDFDRWQIRSTHSAVSNADWPLVYSDPPSVV